MQRKKKEQEVTTVVLFVVAITKSHDDPPSTLQPPALRDMFPLSTLPTARRIIQYNPPAESIVQLQRPPLATLAAEQHDHN